MKAKLLFLFLLVFSFGNAQVSGALTEYNFNNTYHNIYGNAPFSSNAGTSFVTGREGSANGALFINNTGSIATIPYLPYGNSARTVTYWVKMSYLQPTYNFNFAYGTNSTSNAFGGSIASNSIDFLSYANNAGFSSTHTTGTWYFIAYVYDGTTVSVYKNGVLVGSQAKVLNTINNTDLFRLGTGVGYELNSFNGAIDDLKIYDRALSSTEVNTLFTVPDSPISSILVYQFDFDNSYQDNTATKAFATAGSFVIDRNGNPSKALRLNNVGTSVNLDNLPIRNASRTVSVWLKMSSYYSDNYLFGYGDSAANRAYGFSLKSNSVTNYAWANDVANNTAIPLNVWKHIVVTYNSVDDLASLYIDGVLITSITKPDWNTANNTIFNLGKSIQSAQSFDGIIDDLKIYNYALPQNQVTSLYNNNALSTSDFNQNNLEVSMYPNPVNDVLNVKSETELKSVEFYNLQGQKVKISNQKQINVSNLSSGTYMVKIQDMNDGVVTKKIVKQ